MVTMALPRPSMTPMQQLASLGVSVCRYTQQHGNHTRWLQSIMTQALHTRYHCGCSSIAYVKKHRLLRQHQLVSSVVQPTTGSQMIANCMSSNKVAASMRSRMCRSTIMTDQEACMSLILLVPPCFTNLGMWWLAFQRV